MLSDAWSESDSALARAEAEKNEAAMKKVCQLDSSLVQKEKTKERLCVLLLSAEHKLVVYLNREFAMQRLIKTEILCNDFKEPSIHLSARSSSHILTVPLLLFI